MQKSRDFSFTVNNYTVDDCVKLKAIGEKAQYLVVGHEVGESGTPHLQGYVLFKNPRSCRAIVKEIPGHVEPAIAAPIRNFYYCTKGEQSKDEWERLGETGPNWGKNANFWEAGTRPVGQGKRSDIDMVREMVKEGAYLDEIWLATNSYQAFKFGQEGIKLRKPKERGNVTVRWFWGPTGSGKTRKAREMFPDAWVSATNGKWWDGYVGQKEVIIDDFREGWCSFVDLLRILDRYPVRVEIKGGFADLEANDIIITCPFPPERLYCGREDVNQLLRRIHIVEEFVCGTEVGGNSMPLPALRASVPVHEFDPEQI